MPVPPPRLGAPGKRKIAVIVASGGDVQFRYLHTTLLKGKISYRQLIVKKAGRAYLQLDIIDIYL
jgi:hypothetical protein